MNANNQALIRQIVAHVTCSVCGHHFGMSDIQVVGRREQVWAMRVNCRECRTQALLLAIVNDRGTQSVFTDLTPEEWVRFRQAPIITDNDVIAIHLHLASYAGDFSEILDEPLPDE
jgi:hypothetical protein